MLTFTEWLRQIPALYKLLSAAVAVVVGLLAPDRLIPEPLDPYRELASLIVVVAFALTWAWQGVLRRRLRSVTMGAFVLLVALVLLNVLFVREVEYTNPSEVVQVLVGPSVVHAELKGMPDEEVIKTVGVGWGALEQAYGNGFVIVALSYALLYLLLATGIILALGGSQLARPERPPS